MDDNKVRAGVLNRFVCKLTAQQLKRLALGSQIKDSHFDPAA